MKITRNEAISYLRKVLVRRRDALRSALAGDLSLLKELRGQSRGDVADFALDAAQDEISSQQGGAIIGIFASNFVSLLHIRIISTF